MKKNRSGFPTERRLCLDSDNVDGRDGPAGKFPVGLSHRAGRFLLGWFSRAGRKTVLAPGQSEDRIFGMRSKRNWRRPLGRKNTPSQARPIHADKAEGACEKALDSMKSANTPWEKLGNGALRSYQRAVLRRENIVIDGIWWRCPERRRSERLRRKGRVITRDNSAKASRKTYRMGTDLNCCQQEHPRFSKPVC